MRGNRPPHLISPAAPRSIPACAGEPCEHPPEGYQGGAIPACAGEPTANIPPEGYQGVYPRLCGGTPPPPPDVSPRPGLSPPVRGNPAFTRCIAASRGSIPACAGEPLWENYRYLCARVYPRLCGGTPLEIIGATISDGLSPPVRGNLEEGGLLYYLDGSIPACAGEPIASSAGSSTRRVYPRLCGGTSDRTNTSQAPQGLSPPVRGNHCDSCRPNSCRRSIPACAGEPMLIATRQLSRKVYPRLCGGTAEVETKAWLGSGLSPPVRGNPQASPPPAVHAWSIPACAGEPLVTAGLLRRYRVYPRLCGGTITTLR